MRGRLKGSGSSFARALILGVAWWFACAGAAQEAPQASTQETAQDTPQAAPVGPSAAAAVSNPTQGAAPSDARISALEAELAAQRAVISEQQAAIAELRASVGGEAGSGDGSDGLDDSADALIAELEGIGEGAQALAAPDPIQLYGYMDMGVNRLFIDDELLIAGVAPSRETTFILGNINLYIDARPMRDWRGLTELRFTNLPHGEETDFRIAGTNVQYRRRDRVITNVTSPDGRDRVLLGSVILERAWIQWEEHPLATLRVGQWLTPFGIWNVDHGTPVLISLLQPDFQIAQRFPARQLGLQLLGESASGNWVLGYHLTISNGRVPGQLDPSDEKALGGRLHATYRGDVIAKVGMSGYWGEVYDYIKELDVGNASIDTVTTVDGSEWVAGVDLSLDVGALRIRTEGILGRIDFDDGKHAPVRFGQPGTTTPNHYYLDGYLLAAYQLPVWSLEPVMYAEIAHRPASLGDTSVILGPGVNLNFSATVQLKSIVGVVILTDLSGEDTSPKGKNRFATASSRLVLAF